MFIHAGIKVIPCKYNGPQGFADALNETQTLDLEPSAEIFRCNEKLQPII